MNQIRKIFSPIVQVAIWVFVAIVYLGYGKVNVAVHNGLILLLFLVGFGLLLKVKEKLDDYRYIQQCYFKLQHLLYLISKEHDITERITNKVYKDSLLQEIKAGERTDGFNDKNSQRYKFQTESL